MVICEIRVVGRGVDSVIADSSGDIAADALFMLCECDDAGSCHEKVDSLARIIPDTEVISYTDLGRRRLSNEDAFHTDEQLNLHVVCDGIGGQPSGEAASQIIAYSMGHMLRREFAKLTSMDEVGLHGILKKVIVNVSRELYLNSHHIPALKGMGATVVGMLVHAETAHIFNVGDSRAYLYRGGVLHQISNDHTRQYRHYDSITDTLADENAKERRLLCGYIGSPREAKAYVTAVRLQVGDRLMLCTDGVTDPVNDDVLKRIFEQQYPVTDTARLMVEAANRAGGPDNITVTMVEYRGAREAMDADLAGGYPPVTDYPAEQMVKRLFDQLAKLQHDLRMLYDYAEECRSMNQIGAFAAIKRWLGAELYANFLSMSPSRNPVHAFHHAFVLEQSPWRKAYREHMSELQPLVEMACSGKVQLSYLMHPHDTAKIVSTLWNDWRRVEGMYFKVASSEPHPRHDQMINKLIEHMAQSVNTLRGLLEFFPYYMRPEVAAK
ncbi:serine/threonine-protein phosphatase [Planctomycetota bacterium]|nr:serine/threonine-protein phosphatase [Planctomycetota bacterium]